MRKRIAAACLALLLALCLAGCRESAEAKYGRGRKLLDEGKAAEAVTVFEELGDYGDASRMAAYGKAVTAAEAGNYQTALSGFTALGDFLDCPMMIA